MLPDQQFDGIPSANPMPPWTPPVWQVGPDALVAQAQQQLWADYQDIGDTLGSGEGSVSMSGSHTNPENESDELIDGSTPGDSPAHGPASSGRAAQWSSMMNDLYRDEPLASWSTGQKSGKANPAP